MDLSAKGNFRKPPVRTNMVHGKGALNSTDSESGTADHRPLLPTEGAVSRFTLIVRFAVLSDMHRPVLCDVIGSIHNGLRLNRRMEQLAFDVLAPLVEYAKGHFRLH